MHSTNEDLILLQNLKDIQHTLCIHCQICYLLLCSTVHKWRKTDIWI